MRYMWFRVSLLSEFFVQVPAFVVGTYFLYYSACATPARLTADDRRIYPFLVLYGAIGACADASAMLTPSDLHYAAVSRSHAAGRRAQGAQHRESRDDHPVGHTRPPALTAGTTFRSC